jgi:hypothetical protein
MQSVFRINTPGVAHEMIDDEVVIVHLETGRYYSIDLIGAQVWKLVDGGHGKADIARWATSRYNGQVDAIEAALNGFLSELEAEGLIVPDSRTPAGEPPNSSDDPVEFVPPELHKYTDMEELLLLDPIHQVDETGWPNTP